MSINPIVLSIPVFFILICVEVVIQYFSKEKLYRVNDSISNISCGILEQVTGVFIKTSTIAMYHYIYENFSLFKIPQTTWTFLLLFIGCDFFYYWAHRMSHQINLFWGGHVVHHQSEDYNLSVALRQSSFQTFWFFFFYFPLAFLGFNTTSYLFASAIVTLYQFWIHTEKIKTLGPLEYIFNTPSHHRVHHGVDPKYIDKNHAGTFIIWDKMFGTFQKEEEKPTYGITTPANSWNPIEVNLAHYRDMFSTVKRFPKLSDKLRFLLKPPGWLPDRMGGPAKIPQVNKQSYKKYDSDPGIKFRVYAVIQYLSCLLLASLYLIHEPSMSLPVKLVFTGGVILSLISFAGLFEKRIWTSLSEYIRLVSTVALLSYLFYEISWVLTILFTGCLYLFSSLVWFKALLIQKAALPSTNR
ncbi:MAG: alkylglycerol monooxygenase [Chlamydiales bacterium]|jgi:alkylglycerol monooxygenase